MYSQFTREKRSEVSALLRAGHTCRGIAQILGVSPSTISRELRRNRCRNSRSQSGYHAREAHRQAKQRRHQANQHRSKINARLAQLLEELIVEATWSPEQIAGWLKRHRPKLAVCHQTIYTWIKQQRPDLKAHLHCRKGKYRRTRANKQRQLARRKQAAIRHISKRPKHIELRKTKGHWEGDTIHGCRHSGYIATFTERKTGFLVAKVLSKDHFSSTGFTQAALEGLSDLPDRYLRTLTLDNGPEMKQPEELERLLGLSVYYATPYHSWERGTNENTNGLLRFFFPKKMDFSKLTQTELDIAVKLINNRPRKRLGWQSPAKMFRF